MADIARLRRTKSPASTNHHKAYRRRLLCEPLEQRQLLAVAGGYIWEAVESTGLAAVTNGEVAWGDYNNDGRLDVLMAGRSGSEVIARVYQNDGDGTFHDISAGLTGVDMASVAWGDYDNDGRLDILLTGRDASENPVSAIYHNNGDGTFTEINPGLTAVSQGDVAWGDYDNDGRLDILMTGMTADEPIAKIYHNDGDGAFHDIGADLIGRFGGSVSWGDYDNDGRLDIAMTGHIVLSEPILCGVSSVRTTIYHNDGDGAFSSISSYFCPGSETVAWGDYDNDGWLDLLVSGGNGPLLPHSDVYHNRGDGSFEWLYVNLNATRAIWGDYDNDGRLDILQFGNDVWQPCDTSLYHFIDGSFSNVGSPFVSLKSATGAWGDFDNDGYLDVLLTGEDASGNTTVNLYRNVGELLQMHISLSSPPTSDAHAPAVTIHAYYTHVSHPGRVVIQVIENVSEGSAVALDVDLNNDGDFDDPGELGYTTSTFDGESYSATFAIAPELAEGSYRLRARVIDLTNSMEGASQISPLEIIDPATVALYNPKTGQFYLHNVNDVGVADYTFAYDPVKGNLLPIVGDWDGDGQDCVGLYDLDTSMFYLNQNNIPGDASQGFRYGPAGCRWTPIVGDWDGDGVDTIGLYDPARSVFYLRNSNDAGVADETFNYGTAQAWSRNRWKPVAGDWDGDGRDTVGLYNPATATVYLRNSNAPGQADVTFVYGPAGSGWTPTAGDWDGDGRDTIGLYSTKTSMFYLRNVNECGCADATFRYGPVNCGWLPIVGDWFTLKPLGGEALSAVGVGSSSESPSLTLASLQPIVDEAIARWEDAGLDAATIARMFDVHFSIADLPNSTLGEAEVNGVIIDVNAAGHGWFVDVTPTTDEEFVVSANEHRLLAVDPSALDRIDLLTVVEHELGRIAGLADLDQLADDLMSRVLETGLRRTAG